MKTFAFAVLLLAWPFHRKPKPAPTAPYNPMAYTDPAGNTYHCAQNDAGRVAAA